MTVLVVRGNSRHLPLADNTVDLIVTSPPYFALRSYTDGGEHYAGQIGDEPTHAEFVDSLLDVTRECVRVLKPSGSLWINLGDKYAGNQPSSSRWHTASLEGGRGRLAELAESQSSFNCVTWGAVPAKSLMGLPWRFALRCIDDLGLILRAEVIWSKPNGLPESVTDRVRRSHETWFHFVREPRYFSAVDEIREPHDTANRKGLRTSYPPGSASGQVGADGARHHREGGAGLPLNPLGKLPGSVWEIPTEPLRVPAHLGVDHFAAFPTEWPRRIIAGWSPRGVCTVCGEGRRPVTDVERVRRHEGPGGLSVKNANERGTSPSSMLRTNAIPITTITGYVCACPDTTAPTTPGVVLDPFGGTGTTALVAHALGRVGISVDMSADYCRLARWRTTDPGELARALRVDKPPVQTDGQLTLEAS